jgi:hypothetical protein
VYAVYRSHEPRQEKADDPLRAEPLPSACTDDVDKCVHGRPSWKCTSSEDILRTRVSAVTRTSSIYRNSLSRPFSAEADPVRITSAEPAKPPWRPDKDVPKACNELGMTVAMALKKACGTA